MTGYAIALVAALGLTALAIIAAFVVPRRDRRKDG